MELSTGIYESLIYEALKKKLDALNKSQYAVNTLSIYSAEVPRLLTNLYPKSFRDYWLTTNALKVLKSGCHSLTRFSTS